MDNKIKNNAPTVKPENVTVVEPSRNTPIEFLPSDKASTRIRILQATVNVLAAVDVPMHYTRLTAAIADQWSPAPGAKTKAEYTVYSMLYDNAQEIENCVVFLRSGVFGLKGKTYSPEAIKAVVPPRKASGRVGSDGKSVVIVPTELTAEQRQLLETMGILKVTLEAA